MKSLTAGNDTIDGSIENSLEGDTIVDASTTDTDVLNASITANITNATSVSNVETVNITDKFGSNSVDVSKFAGVNSTLSDSPHPIRSRHVIKCKPLFLMNLTRL